ncbi:hypothetical protein [Rathayibacter sp. VKM Ac-2630]|uniref:hypothetical protein n=1 Tax=Rathayibacter sp. VKM Ac-2630 TaxID=1938617 RepID=UPI000981F526|nr:hypothetical protein [Rathayibacter sp. VKM Ac-2630]OOB91209.1 hypothetical protein B0T42_07375 [Rathayibacter sp. VKM Ac-2630]
MGDALMSKDDRLYAPFDIGMDEHPKVIILSNEAFRAFFEGIFYARRMMSDGFLDKRIVLRRWGQDVADELSANDPERPSWVPVENGWQIRDFEKHHPLRAEIEEKRAAVSKAKADAGRKSGQVRRQKAEQASNSDEQTTNTIEQTANRAEQSGNITRTKLNPETETETETETTPSNEGVSAPESKSTRRKPESPLPDGWGPANSAYEYCDLHGIDIRHEESQFRNHAAANDRRQRDWDAAFRTWLGNAKKYQTNATQPRPTAAQKNMPTVDYFRRLEEEEQRMKEIEG